MRKRVGGGGGGGGLWGGGRGRINAVTRGLSSKPMMEPINETWSNWVEVLGLGVAPVRGEDRGTAAATHGKKGGLMAANS